MDFQYNTGYIPSLEDRRDWKVSSLNFSALSQVRASLETFVARIDNQQAKPWCVAFGVCNAVEFMMRRNGLPVPDGGFSKAWLYAMCKQNDGIPSIDGTYIRTAFSIARNYGLCPDALCPTNDYLYSDKLPQLTAQMLTEAGKYKITGYARLENYEIKQTIANGGFVVIGSFVEMDNWLDGDDLITEPKGTVLGGHCTYLFGYDDAQAIQSIQGFCGGANSWGEGWGSNGKYKMSYHYMNHKVDGDTPVLYDAWTFTVGGGVKMSEVQLEVKPEIINDHFMLPFRAIYEALGGNVRWYRNSEGKVVGVAELAMKDKNVTVEVTQDSTTLKVYNTA